MLDAVKLALRITTNDFNAEINLIIDDCIAELSALGVLPVVNYETDPQIRAAVIYYAKWKFGDSDNAERWADIYKDKVQKLSHMSGYGLKAAF